MGEFVFNQLYQFFIYFLSGIIIAIFFDIFRILRKSFKTIDIVTYIQDILFWIITGLFLIYVIFKFNNGELRIYIFIAILCGALIYLITFSKIFIYINVKIIKTVKFIIKKIYSIIIFPIHISSLFFNRINIFLKRKIKKVIMFYVKKCKKVIKLKEKKDFRQKCRK